MTESDSRTATSKQPSPPLGELGEFVHRRLAQLQAQQLRQQPAARATLARLRRAVNKEPGSVPEVWEFTLGGLPADSGFQGEEPVPPEHAAHIAMTLYAVHQQSRSKGMHQRGIGLGTALRRLAKGSADDVAVTRRFQALGTAQSLDEFVYHARGLVGQLRAESIPLDYGLLADQLLLLQDERRVDGVRLRWGRDFYRAWQPEPDPETDDDQSNGDNS